MSALPPDLAAEIQALASSGRTLLVGPLDALAAGEIVGAGRPFDVEEEIRPDPSESHDAIVLCEPPAAGRIEEELRRARRRLRAAGRILIADPRGALEPRRTVLALSEAGFVVLEPPHGSPASGRWLGRKDRFFVRPYRDGDEEQILPMFRRRFHVERSLARWRWAYREDPYGALHVSEAFTEEGRLAGQYAGYPVEFDLVRGGPRTLAALQIGDTMTEPDLQYFGDELTRLLPRIVRHFYARFCEGRTAFNYGFNTGKIQRFSLRLARARKLEDVPFHVRELAGGERRPARRLRALLGGWRVERVTAFDRRWDELYARVRDAYGFLVRRDARYLEWRYARCPDVEYFIYAVSRRGELAGWSVFRAKGSALAWGDALFDPSRPEAARQLLAHVAASDAHRDARSIVTWASARPAWWRTWVTALGFEVRPEPDDLAFVFVPFEVDPEDDFRALLYYSMGDSDLF